MERPRTYATIAGVGSHVPENVVTNEDMTRIVETSDEWIVSRTGIKERRIALDDETTSDMATRAAVKALSRAGVDACEIDQIIVATSSADHLMPSAACIVASNLGSTCAAYDLNAACSGFIYALQVGASAIESGRARCVVVIGADMLSRVLDFTDRTTCVLFGDGAGAVVLKASDEPGVLSTVLGSDGSGKDMLIIPAGGSKAPCTHERIDAREQYLRMNGKEVFKFAVRIIPKATEEALALSGHTVSDLDWLIPHQANQRILNTVAERLGLPNERIVSHLETVGNTSAASIPLALDELYTSGQLKPGDLLGLVGFGAGLTWAAAIVRWS